MVASGPWTASPDGSGNFARMELSLWMHVQRYFERIRLVARVQPNCHARSCRNPGYTAASSDFHALPARLSVDGRLSRADGQSSSDNIPGSGFGLQTVYRNLWLCYLSRHACRWRVQRRAGPAPASQYSFSIVSRLPSFSVGPRWWEFQCSLMALALASEWQHPGWPLLMAVMVSPRACWSRVWRAEVLWFSGILWSCWHTFLHTCPLLASRNS